MLENLGWLDSAGVPQNVTLTTDILSLPSTVSSALSEEEIEQCTEDLMDEWQEEPEIRRWGITHDILQVRSMIFLLYRCASSWPEEQVWELEEVASRVAGFHCFQKIFRR